MRVIVFLSRFVFRFDFDNQAISPPAHDESFFYIRYPTGATSNDKKATASSNTLKSSISDAITKQQLDTKTKSAKALLEKKNMVQHTEPCKQYLNQKERGKLILKSNFRSCWLPNQPTNKFKLPLTIWEWDEFLPHLKCRDTHF